MVPLFFCSALIKSDIKSGCPPAPPLAVVPCCSLDPNPVTSLLFGGFGGSFFIGSCGGAEGAETSGGGGGGGENAPEFPTSVN